MKKKKYCGNFRKLIFLAALNWMIIPLAQAATVTLSWDQNSDAVYYVVYWGTSYGEPTTNSGNIGNVTTYQITGLVEDTAYYFAVKAFNGNGDASDFSEWISTAPLTDLEGGASVAAEEEITDTQTADSEGTTETTEEPETVSDGETTDGTETADVADELNEEPDGADILDGEPEEENYPYAIESDIPVNNGQGDDAPDTSSSFSGDDVNYAHIEVLDHAFNHLFWLKSGWSEYNDVNTETRIAVGDLDGDGQDETIIGFAPVEGDPSIPGGVFQILDDDYTHLAWGKIEWADYNEANGETWPACGDVDGDGKDEIIMGLGTGGRGYIEVFDLIDGSTVSQGWLTVQWPDYNELNGETRPSCGDIDADGIDEIIAGFGGDQGNTDIPAGKFEIFKWSNDTWNHVLWGSLEWDEYAEINGETWPAPGDIDGDGNMELAVGLGYGGDGQMAIFEFQQNQAVLIEWAQIDWPDYNAFLGETRPSCGDIDNDGKDEVILSWNTHVSDSENENFMKVLSYNSAGKGWNDSLSSKVVTDYSDSVPTRGAVGKNDTILVSLGDVVLTGTSQAVTSLVNDSGSGGGGSGCLIDSMEFMTVEP